MQRDQGLKSGAHSENDMTQSPVLERVKRIGTGVSFIAFPVMLLMGFVLQIKQDGSGRGET